MEKRDNLPPDPLPPRYSIVVPVYNRPEEVDELLDSLTRQSVQDFEVVVVEDGSTRPCREVVERYGDRLSVHYIAKPNSGPGPSRNLGARHATGRWLLLLDSDVVVPPGYVQAIDEALRGMGGDAMAVGTADGTAVDDKTISQAIEASAVETSVDDKPIGQAVGESSVETAVDGKPISQAVGESSVETAVDDKPMSQAVEASAVKTLVDATLVEPSDKSPVDARPASQAIVTPSAKSAVDDELVCPDIDVRPDLRPVAAFGGPDRAHPSFTPLQRAIDYAMTSLLTTGGIRGSSRRRLDRFHPRSFNMGIDHDAFDALGGFRAMRFGEDIDLSLRVLESGRRTALIPDAWVWHKRRTNLRKFFRQVHCSGMARIHLMLLHPGSLRLVHLLPSAFTLGCLVLLLASPVCPWSLVPIALFALAAFVDAVCRTRSLRVGVLAVAASVVQLVGYGTGLLRAWWQCCLRHRQPIDDPFGQKFYR